MSREQLPHIAIVGGGMVGLSLALLLAKAKQNWRISLVESYTIRATDAPFQPSFDHRSTALSAGTQKIFSELGLWPRLSEHATPIQSVHVSDRGHFGGARLDNHYDLAALGYVVENPWFGRVLAEAVLAEESIELLAPVTVIAAKPKANGYQLSLSEHSDLHTDLLLVADGADSPLCQQLGIQRSQEDYHQSAIVANVRSEKPNLGVAYERFTEEGPIALLPLDKHSSALIWTLPEERAEHILSLDDGACMAKLQHRFGHRLGIFTAISQRYGHPLKLTLSQEVVRRHLAVVGNAAHSLHPVAGQGFNLALRNAEALVRQLQKSPQAPGDLSVLDAYVAERELDQTLTVQLSDQLVRQFSTDQWLTSSLRSLGLVALNCAPLARRQLAKQTMGLA